jgi:hypothetical protein
MLDLNGTLVADLGPLYGLTALQGLYLGRTRVADLEPLIHVIISGRNGDFVG